MRTGLDQMPAGLGGASADPLCHSPPNCWGVLSVCCMKGGEGRTGKVTFKGPGTSKNP